MANVEEDLGEGMYALRWAGNRIAVSSRVALSAGQSLILKSEISPEGKPTLVVQGPALPEPGEIMGRVIYGPGERGARRESGEPSSAQSRQPGHEVAAGVERAAAAAPGQSQPVQTLLGLVLEPLTDFEAEVARLLLETAEEKKRWQPGQKSEQGEKSEKGGQAERGNAGEAKPTPGVASEGKVIAGDAAAGTVKPEARPLPLSPGEIQLPPEAESPLPPAASRPGESSPPASGAEKSPPPAIPSDGAPSATARPLPVPDALPPSAENSAPPSTGNQTRPETPSLARPENAGRPVQVPESGGSTAAPGNGTAIASPENAANAPQQTGSAPATPALPSPPAEANASAISDNAGSHAAGPDVARGEAFVKEALTQLVKAAELPLAGSTAESQSLGVGGAMPEAIADKAAGILLRAAGLTPDPATMEVARALVDANVQVDRQTVQALMALTAGVPEDEREAVLRAAARLAAKDVPLAAPLAGGLADVMARRAGVHELVERTSAALALETPVPAARPLVDAARELLALLHVDLGQADAASALERYISTFGREVLGKTLALVERAAQAVLENHPLLPRIDQAMTVLLARLEDSLAQAEAQGAAKPGDPAPAAPTQPGTQPSPPPGVAETPATSVPSTPAPVPAAPAAPASSAPAAEQPLSTAPPSGAAKPAPEPPPPVDAPRPTPHSPINAYLNSPRAFPGLEALNLPPMPKVASLNIPPSAPPIPEIPAVPPATAGDGQAAATPQPVPGAPPPPPSPPQPLPPGAAPTLSPHNADAAERFAEHLTKALGGRTEQELAPDKARLVDGEVLVREGASAQQAAEAQRQLRSAVLMKLEAIFQLPGLNRPEFEILRPLGILDRFLSMEARGEGADKTRSDAERLVRELLSDDPEKAAKTLRNLSRADPAVLRETAARLSRMEAEIIRNEPLLSRLSDAANSLRDLGRQLLAVKAENVAGQEREPGVMLAEVPLKFNDEAGDGRMQMFYRKSRGKQGGWTSRVILDLNTTGLGPVLGDMRFFGQDMILNMFVDKQNTADFLAVSAEDLVAGLAERGFRVKPRFMVLPPPPPPPEIHAERPELAGEEGDSSSADGTRSIPRRHTGRLDTKA